MPDEPSDQQLMASVGRSDEEAFRQIVRLHGRYLFGIARTLTRDSAEAEDAVQETLTALLTAARKAQFRGESSLRTFLVALLIRQCALIRRKRRGWPGHVLRLVRPPEAEHESSESQTDAKLDLAALLEKLSPEHREVLVMRELQQMSYEAMAEVLAVPRGTIESRLHRARQQLKELWSR